MNVRYLLDTANYYEESSGLQHCLYLNETTSKFSKVLTGTAMTDIMWVLLMLFGLTINFYGNRIVKPLFAGTGFILGGIVGLYSCFYYSSWFSNLDCTGLYVISTITGLIVASIALTVYRISFALVGGNIQKFKRVFALEENLLFYK